MQQFFILREEGIRAGSHRSPALNWRRTEKSKPRPS